MIESIRWYNFLINSLINDSTLSFRQRGSVRDLWLSSANCLPRGHERSSPPPSFSDSPTLTLLTLPRCTHLFSAVRVVTYDSDVTLKHAIFWTATIRRFEMRAFSSEIHCIISPDWFIQLKSLIRLFLYIEMLSFPIEWHQYSCRQCSSGTYTAFYVRVCDGNLF